MHRKTVLQILATSDEYGPPKSIDNLKNRAKTRSREPSRKSVRKISMLEPSKRSKWSYRCRVSSIHEIRRRQKCARKRVGLGAVLELEIATIPFFEGCEKSMIFGVDFSSILDLKRDPKIGH